MTANESNLGFFIEASEHTDAGGKYGRLNQDRSFCASIPAANDTGKTHQVFGVFDGHGPCGHIGAECCRDVFLAELSKPGRLDEWASSSTLLNQGLRDMFKLAHQEIVRKYTDASALDQTYAQCRGGTILAHYALQPLSLNPPDAFLRPSPWRSPSKMRSSPRRPAPYSRSNSESASSTGELVYVNVRDPRDIRPVEFGTTAVVVVVFTTGAIVAANAGDSMAALGRRGGSGRWILEAPLSVCHNVTNRVERQRVTLERPESAEERQGPSGEHSRMEYRRSTAQAARGVYYLYPVFAAAQHPAGLTVLPSQGIMLTRSLGHKMLEPLGITFEPDIKTIQMRPGDEYILLVASDGLWERLPPQHVLRLAAQCESAAAIAHMLVATALHMYGEARYADNVTVITAIIRWQTAPP